MATIRFDRLDDFIEEVRREWQDFRSKPPLRLAKREIGRELGVPILSVIATMEAPVRRFILDYNPDNDAIVPSQVMRFDHDCLPFRITVEDLQLAQEYAKTLEERVRVLCEELGIEIRRGVLET